MNSSNIKLPVYAKIILLFFGLLALFTVMYIAQGILIPLVFAAIIAIVLHPVVNLFIRLRINRVFSIIIVLILAFSVIVALCILIVTQLNRFSESWPILVEKFAGLLHQSTSWAAGYFDINPEKIQAWIINTKSDFFETSGSAIGKTIVNVGSGLLVLILIPVYVFMLLFYQPLLLDFIHKLFAKSHQLKVNEIVSQTKNVIQRYLVGLVIEAVLVAALNSLGLFILGIQYAILLGIIGALLNIIPYIGGLIAVALPMMVALVTKSSAWYAVYVLAVYYFIQLIDNNFIVPKIVASQVRINALFSIIAVIVGNALWGIPGMFLAIPLLAIVKLIFDHIEAMKPWGFLLGDTMPPMLKILPILKKIKLHD